MTDASTTSRLRRATGPLGWLVVLVLLLAGCTAQAAERPATDVTATPATSAAPADPSAPASVSTAPQEPIPDARVGKPASSERVRFIPDRLVLATGDKAAVQPASTVGGELKVPEDVRHLGWWDGGSQAGDPFGATVVAGHVDSKTQGLGFFAKLLQIRKGQKVTLQGEGHTLSYVVRTISTVKKDALAADSAAFGDDGNPRLVLITCGGAYLPGQGGYDSNIVVIAEPVGLAR